MTTAGYTNILFSSQTEAPDCRSSGNNRILLHSIIRLGCRVYLYSVSALASHWQFFASLLLVLALPVVLLALCPVLLVLCFTHSSLPRTSRTFPLMVVTDSPVRPCRVRSSDTDPILSNYESVRLQIVACQCGPSLL